MECVVTFRSGMSNGTEIKIIVLPLPHPSHSGRQRAPTTRCPPLSSRTRGSRAVLCIYFLKVTTPLGARATRRHRLSRCVTRDSRTASSCSLVRCAGVFGGEARSAFICQSLTLMALRHRDAVMLDAMCARARIMAYLNLHAHRCARFVRYTVPRLSIRA